MDCSMIRGPKDDKAKRVDDEDVAENMEEGNAVSQYQSSQATGDSKARSGNAGNKASTLAQTAVTTAASSSSGAVAAVDPHSSTAAFSATAKTTTTTSNISPCAHKSFFIPLSTVSAPTKVNPIPRESTSFRNVSSSSTATMTSAPPQPPTSDNNRPTLRHQATFLTGNTRADPYDEDLLCRAVEDAGRWAYGTIFVEVWLLTQDGLALIRPHLGWWVDPTVHSEYHNPAPPPVTKSTGKGRETLKSLTSLSSRTGLSASTGTNNNNLNQFREQQLSCPICRLTDDTRVDYLEPAPMVPGEGLPGVLWSDDINPEFLNPVGHSGSFRGGGPRAPNGSFQARGVGGGSRGLGSSGFLFPRMQQMYEEGGSRGGGGDGGGNRGRAGASEPFVTSGEILMPSEGTGQASGDGSSHLGRGGRRLQRLSHLHYQHPHQHPKVVWRNIKALADDPDLPWNPRLQHLAAIGLGWAAAVPIRHEGEKKGIVIYMARAGVDLDRLTDVTNETYLVAASNLISAALILRIPRHEAIKGRHAEFSDAMRRIRARILEARAAYIPLDELAKRNSEKRKQDEEAQANRRREMSDAPDSQEYTNYLLYLIDRLLYWLGMGFDLAMGKSIVILRKCMGGNVKPPPAFTWKQSIHTFIAVLMTLLIVTNINRVLINNHGQNFAIVLGPFGALMTLVYGLTAAPASQPRNAILGQALSATVAILLQFVPHSVWSTEMRASVTTALAVAMMTKMGLTHPPAGASALLFALDDSRDWSNMATLLLGNVVVVVVASLLNNVSSQRQYPTFWGVGGFVDLFFPGLHGHHQDTKK